MKKLLSITFVAAVVAAMFGCTGCATAPKNSSAVYIGMTIHQSYTKIAESTTNTQFKADIETLWTEIDKVDTVQGMTNVYNRMTVILDRVYENKGINEKQKRVVNVVRKIIEKALEKATDPSLESEKRDNAVAWLKAMREGIRLMRTLESDAGNSECLNECKKAEILETVQKELE